MVSYGLFFVCFFPSGFAHLPHGSPCFKGAMMLVDGNLDGAVSPEELQKVLNFVKVRAPPGVEDEV